MRIFLTRMMFIVSIIGICSMSLFGAPHNGEVFKLLQPDGSEVQVRVYGDEFYQRVESLDGFTLVKDPVSGWINYAELSDDGSEFIPTGMTYSHFQTDDFSGFNMAAPMILRKKLRLKKNIILKKVEQTKKELLGDFSLKTAPQRASMAAALQPASIEAAPRTLNGHVLTGQVKGLTLLIDFSDDESTISKESVENYVNLNGYNEYGNNGSIRDYFQDVSGGLLDYTNHVTAYYRAQNPKSYYVDESVSYGRRAQELIAEALNYLEDEAGFDFSTLSTDENGRIRAINAFYAGNTRNGWSKGLWPHKWNFYHESFSADGVDAYTYQITNIGSRLTLGTFAHENGHMLFGWPDLYDYGYESRGIGRYGLMASSGSTNPVPPNPYFRSVAGWEEIVDITDAEKGIVYNHQANSNKTYKYANPNNPKEFFLIESRMKNNRNRYIPDEGLIVWHIDERGSNNNEQMTCSQHYKVSVEQADGRFRLENRLGSGGGGDLFHAGYKDVFSGSTSPNSDWWCDGPSSLEIENISEVSENMTFTLKQVIAKNYNQVYVRGTNNDWNANDDSKMELIDNHLWQLNDVQFGNTDDERFKFDIDGDWTTTFGDNNNDGTAENGGEDITIAAGKKYNITFNDQTLEYKLIEIYTPNLKVAVENSEVTLTWNEVQTGSSHIEIRRKGEQDSDFILIGDIASGASYVDSNVEDGKTYEYKIKVDSGSFGIYESEIATVTVGGNSRFQRTIIMIEGQTVDGQDMFIRGGVDHDYANTVLGRNCQTDNFECAIPIKFLNKLSGTTDGWKDGDNYLDWYGKESSQGTDEHGNPEGSALDWTTDLWPSDWGTTPYYERLGYGETPLNTYGMHYWIMEVEMDCSATVDGWFELKSYISNGPGWESNVSQPGTPYESGNHFAQCGKMNVFKRGQSESIDIKDIPVGL